MKWIIFKNQPSLYLKRRMHTVIEKKLEDLYEIEERTEEDNSK
jgi:hypothetical protein